MRIKNLLKTIPVAIAGAFMLTSCAGGLSTTLEVHDENTISATVIVSYDHNELSEGAAKELLDENFPVSDEVEVTEASDDTKWSRTYTWNNTTLEEFEEAHKLTVNPNTGSIVKEEDKYVATFPYAHLYKNEARASTFTVEMPGRILVAEGAEVKGNKATWVINDYVPEAMVVESTLTPGFPWVPFLVVASTALVAGGGGTAAAVAANRKKKAKEAEASEDS